MNKGDESWVMKYRPKTIKEVVGNSDAIRKTLQYLKTYRYSDEKSKMKCCIFITGPHGSGKTECAKILSLQRGFIPIIFNTTALRRKQEIKRLNDVYESDIIKNMQSDHPDIITAEKRIKRCKMEGIKVGKSIIIDDLESMTKGTKGLMTMITDKIQNIKKYNPDRILILTGNESIITRQQSIINKTYHVKFKKITDTEMMKIVNKICEGEYLKLTNDDKNCFIKYSNGDCRRLINGMEICLRNSPRDISVSDLSRIIKTFVNSDQETLNRLKYTNVSNEEIICETIEKIRAGKGMEMLDNIEANPHTYALQIYKVYPTIIDKKIQMETQLDILARASEKLSEADQYGTQIRTNNWIDYTELNRNYATQTVLAPLNEMKNGMSKKIKIDGSKYARINGIRTVKTNQGILKEQIYITGNGLFFNKDYEELRVMSQVVSKLIIEQKYEEICEFLITNKIDLQFIKHLAKIKIMQIKKMKCLSNVWNKGVERKLKEMLKIKKPKIRGLKFKDDKRSVNKILFFEKYGNAWDNEDENKMNK